ncbi:MAG: hypothetical protein ACIAXF_14145, partial [Phycisphaerales bacterium JB063]
MSKHPAVLLLALVALAMGCWLLPGCDDGGGVTDATDAGLTAQEGEIASAVQAMLAREGNAMVRITD